MQQRITKITTSNGNVRLEWVGAGKLQWAPAPNGPWTTIHNVTSPCVRPLPNSPRAFYRIDQSSGEAPVLQGPSQVNAGSSFALTWTYSWPGLFGSTEDGYELQRSATSSTSGFTTLLNTRNQNDRQSPRSYMVTESGAGNYWYRVRARKQTAWTGWSNVVSVRVVAVTGYTRFENRSSHIIVSLKIDGVEQFPHSPLGIAPNHYYQLQLAPGTHGYRMVNGFWNPGGTRFEMYVNQGQFTQRQGVIEQVIFQDPGIAELLTRFQPSALWKADFWQNGMPHQATFRFLSNGTFNFYVDGSFKASGPYRLVRRNPTGLFTVTFEAGGYEGVLYETMGFFTMWNGPPLTTGGAATALNYYCQ